MSTTFTEVLPARKSSKKSAINWQIGRAHV